MSWLSIGHRRSARYRVGALLAISSIVVLGSTVASHASDPTYPVPEDGLSFDALNTLEENPCTEGYGNNPFVEEPNDDEVNYLRAGDSLVYRDVMSIDGVDIDAKVTLTAIVGMVVPDGAPEPRLNRLDKCDLDDDAHLLEMRFDSAVATPGEAYYVVTIDFFIGTEGEVVPTVPATLTNLQMNVEDIDNNQYLQVDGTTNRLASNRGADDVQEYRDGEIIGLGGGIFSDELEMSDSARRYHATGDSSSGDEKHVVEVTYASVSTLNLRLGTYEAGDGSFDLNFRRFTFTTDPVTTAPTTESTPKAMSVSPAIHLDLQGRVGGSVSTSPALIEGQGLQRSSEYRLRLGPGGQELKSGTVSQNGTFSHSISLAAGLAPGRYFVELSAIGANGTPLVLKQFFTVGANGVLASLEPAIPGAASSAYLATTGSGENAGLLAFGSLGLLLVGLTLVVSARRLRKRLPVTR